MLRLSGTGSLTFTTFGGTQLLNHSKLTLNNMELLGNILRGLLGMAVMTGVLYLMSNNRKRINWRLVGGGMLLQFVVALLVLRVPFVRNIFDGIASFFVVVLDFTKAGTTFLFRSMETGSVEAAVVSFIFTVLPTIIFFSALS